MQQQFTAIQKQAEADNQELRRRLSDLNERLQSERGRSIANAGDAAAAPADSARLHTTYSELTTRPTLGTKLSYAVDLKVIVAICLFLMFTIFLGVMSGLPRMIVHSEFSYFTLRIVLDLATVVSLVFVVWIVYRRVQQLTRYYDYSARMLREIYIRSDSPELLLTADNILRSSLEQFGPSYAKRFADDRLAQAFPEIFHYLRHSESDPAFRE